MEQLSIEYQIVFKTTLPAEFHVDATQIQLAGSSTPKDLSQVLTQLFEDPDLVKGKKFNFMVQD